MALMLREAEDSWGKARQLLCCSMRRLQCHRPALCAGQKDPGQTEEHHSAAAAFGPASTILIVNISNSTLVHCVIGKDPPAVVEKQPLMQRNPLDLHGQNGCSCSPAPAPNIQISSSNLECVTFGNNNYMKVEQVEPREEEPEEDCEEGS